MSNPSLLLADTCVVSDVLLGTIKDKLETEMAVRGQKLVAAGGYKPKVGLIMKLIILSFMCFLFFEQRPRFI